MNTPVRRLIIGISGASGTAYGVRLLQALRQLGIETHLVISKPGELTAARELGPLAKGIRSLASVNHP